MAVDTKNVTNRREIRLESYDQLIAEANSLASNSYQPIGNWSLAQVLDHLTKTHVGSIDGGIPDGPLPFKIMAQLFLKNTFLNKGLPAGATPPEAVAKAVMPNDEVEAEDSLKRFIDSCERLKSEAYRVKHPFLGKLNRENWEKFHCRHAELHFSFLLPLSQDESY